MKLSGGDWSKGDFLALVGIVVALVALVPAILSIPGMPRLFGYADADREPRREQVTTKQVNFDCNETKAVETPVIALGLNPRDVKPSAEWTGLGGAKSYGHTVVWEGSNISAVGSISGRDSGMLGCPGGGNGELVLTVTWTADRQP